MNKPYLLIDIAKEARVIIDRARAAGVTVDDGNVVDLLADNMPSVPLDTFRYALAIAGAGNHFPRAERRRL